MTQWFLGLNGFHDPETLDAPGAAGTAARALAFRSPLNHHQPIARAASAPTTAPARAPGYARPIPHANAPAAVIVSIFCHPYQRSISV